MKLKFKWGGMLILTTLFLFIFLIFPNFVQGKVLLNEIFPNPAGQDKGKEFIEVYNSGPAEVSLKDWFIKRISKKGIIKNYKFKEIETIKKGAYFTLKTDSLNNDGATIELFNNQIEKIDNQKYDKVVEGRSYNREEKNLENTWYWAMPSKNKKNLPNPILEKYPQIVITEILPNPDNNSKNKDEFIELYNPNNQEIDLQGWQLKDASKTGNYIFKNKTVIKEKSYFVIYHKDFKFALNNTGKENVILLAPNNKINNSLTYKNTKKNFSYNYNQKTKKWSWSKVPTPGEKNILNHLPTFRVEIPSKIFQEKKSLFEVMDIVDEDNDKVKVIWDFGDGHKEEGHKVKYKYIKSGRYKITITADDGSEQVFKTTTVQVNILPLSKIIFTKLLPNPDGSDTGRERISLKNIGKEDVNLNNYKIATGTSIEKIVRHTISQELILKSGEIMEISNKQICKFTLTNKKGIVQLLMPDNRIIDEVRYEKENILSGQEYFLVESNQWQWTKENILYNNNHLPTFKIKQPKRIYKNIYAEFKIKNLKNKDGDKLKIVWDFGDGHKSYLKKTRHKYKKTGKYKVVLIVKDSKEKVSKIFNVKVKKYPKYKLQIVGLMPNPDGKDRGKEFIILKNNNKKKINLSQYKIATGRTKKKLMGHPFYENFIIKAGETKKLFNKTISKFSLLNKTGIIQLLYPNGKVADEVNYSKNKISPNEQYLLNANKNWQWEGGILSNSSRSNNSGIQVLGSKTNEKYLDITLNTKTKMCETIQRIKIANWQAGNSRNKLETKLLYFRLNKYSKRI